MLKKSSTSAKRKSKQEDKFISLLRKTVKKSKQNFPEVKKVLLFGSRARDDWGLRSDADVLVILKESEHHRFFDRIPRYMNLFSELLIPIDIFPYTEEELDRMLKMGNELILRALKEGILLG